MEYLSNEIGDRIEKMLDERNEKGYIAMPKIGLAKGTLNNFKTSMPKADTLARIADYLDCSVDYLLGREDKKIAPVIETEDELKEFTDRLIQLSQEEMQELDNYLAFLEYKRNLNS